MAERIKINGIYIKQPLEGLGYGFKKMYSSDSTFVQSGREYTTTVGTYEEFTYSAVDLKKEELSIILQQIIDEEVFVLHYMSPYYGEWRDDEFKVESASVSVGRWVENDERYKSLSFTMTGVNPIGKR